MVDMRYDIVPVEGGWLLTDWFSPPRPYLTSQEAIDGALAAAGGRRVEIYVWREGLPVPATSVCAADKAKVSA